jgi:hypothetical protein
MSLRALQGPTGGGAPVGGSGTTNTIPRWDAGSPSTTLTDSGLIDNGTAVYTSTRRVGVDTSTTLANVKLQVGTAASLANYQGAPLGVVLPAGSGSWLELAENSASGTSFRISKDSSTGVVLNTNGKTIGFTAAGYTTAISSSQVVLTTTGNVGIGTASPTAGRSLTTAADIDVYGVRVGRGAGAQASNTAVGASALNVNSTGFANTAFGGSAGVAVSTGSYNTFTGYNAGYLITTGASNIAIGVDASPANGSNQLAIGSSARFVATNGGATTYYTTATALSTGTLPATCGFIRVYLNGSWVKIPVYAD